MLCHLKYYPVIASASHLVIGVHSIKCEGDSDSNAPVPESSSSSIVSEPATATEVEVPLEVREFQDYMVDRAIDWFKNIHGRSPDGYTLLHYAAGAYSSEGGINVIEPLIKLGLDPNDQANYSKYTPLHDASAYLQWRTSVPVLIKHGANPFLRNRQGQTPLERASLMFNQENLDLLKQCEELWTLKRSVSLCQRDVQALAIATATASGMNQNLNEQFAISATVSLNGNFSRLFGLPDDMEIVLLEFLAPDENSVKALKDLEQNIFGDAQE